MRVEMELRASWFRVFKDALRWNAGKAHLMAIRSTSVAVLNRRLWQLMVSVAFIIATTRERYRTISIRLSTGPSGARRSPKPTQQQEEKRHPPRWINCSAIDISAEQRKKKNYLPKISSRQPTGSPNTKCAVDRPGGLGTAVFTPH